MDFVYDLSKQIENFVLQLPDQIEMIEKLIHKYRLLVDENESLQKENEILKIKIESFEKIPIVPCEII